MVLFGDLKVRLAKSLPILLILTFSLFHVNVVRADLVQVTGHVYDDEGKSVEGVFVAAFSLTPPWKWYGQVVTDAGGHYSLSLERPQRTDFPKFYKGRPVYEGYGLLAGAPSDGKWRVMEYNPGDFVDTEGGNAVQHDFKLKRAGVLVLEAYNPDGSRIKSFPDQWEGQNRTGPVFTTDFDWRVWRSVFRAQEGILLVGLNEANVINFPWNVPGFGKVILRADNGGEGYVFTRPGDEMRINLNYELARTEFRLLKESHERYVREGYTLPSNLTLPAQSAEGLLIEAASTFDGSKKAHFADLCLNRTLWARESLELEKASQDIEMYRKGDVTIQVVDSDGNPADGVQISVAQTTHDFLFGAQFGPSFDRQGFELLREAGINYAQLSLTWRETEPSFGHYELDPVSKIEGLREEGTRIGGYWMLILEPGGNTWDTGLMNLDSDELADRVNSHVRTIVAQYSAHADRWEIAGDSNLEGNSLGLGLGVLDLNKIAADVAKGFNPNSAIIATFGHPCGFDTAYLYEGSDDDFTTDAYSFFPYLQRVVGSQLRMGLALWYGSTYEFYPGTTEVALSSQIAELPFRDLASLSRLLDWYGTLSVPVEITAFNAPSNYTSTLGYWHRRAWDEQLQAEWVEKFYTIAFSKPRVAAIGYQDPKDQTYMVTGRGLLTASNVPRESYYALKNLITKNWTTKLSMRADANGQAQFRGFAGNYTITIRTENGLVNSTIHVSEQTSQAYTIRIGQPSTNAVTKVEAEQAIAKAAEAVSKAKTEGRTILLDKAESLLQDARKALSEENYGQATVLAGEANQAADSAATWLIIPVAVVSIGLVLAVIVWLRKRARKTD